MSLQGQKQSQYASNIQEWEKETQSRRGVSRENGCWSRVTVLSWAQTITHSAHLPTCPVIFSVCYSETGTCLGTLMPRASKKYEPWGALD